MKLVQIFRRALYLLIGANYAGGPNKSEDEHSWEETDKNRTYFGDIYSNKLTWVLLLGYIIVSVLICWILNPAEWVVVCLLGGFAFLWARLISAKVIFASYLKRQKRKNEAKGG